MGRYIDLNKPLTKEDREYLMSRAQEGDVVVNDRRFAGLSAEEKAELSGEVDQDKADYESDREAFERQVEEENDTEFDEDILDRVSALNYNEVRQALAKLELDSKGTKEEVYSRLLNHLQDEADAKREAEEKAQAAYVEQQHK